MAQLVHAYDTRTGKKLAHQVPAKWIGHPILGKHLSLTPRQKAADTKKAAPTQGPAPKAPLGGEKEE